MQPDITGFEIGEAQRILEGAGYQMEVPVLTQAPRGGDSAGEARVVRQRVLQSGRLQLVVAYRMRSGGDKC